MSRSLIVLPNDSAKPMLDAIGSAKKSIRIKIFALSDPTILEALVNAHKRAVIVRVMLNPARRSGEIQNIGSRTILSRARIDVLDSNPGFDVTHEKSMVIDDRTALIGSPNWEPENFEETRDFAVMTTEPSEVMEIIRCFEADWSRQEFKPPISSNLIWCPGMGRRQIAQFIDSAEHSLFIQNERFQDAIIVDHIVQAKRRGVKVHVMTRPSHSLRPEQLVDGVGDLRIMQDVGIKLRKIKHLKLHAKLLLADGSRAIIGSINLTTGSFDRRRELAIQVRDPNILSRLWGVLREDWKNSRPLDLTDEGLLSDMEKHPKHGGLSRVRSMTTNLSD